MKDRPIEPETQEEAVQNTSRTTPAGREKRVQVAVQTRQPRRAWSLEDSLLLVLLALIGALLVLAGGNLLLRALALAVVLGGAYWLFEAR